MADAERFRALGVAAARMTVMGDARFDQVAQRARSARETPRLEALKANADATIVAGSTWPEDEKHLLTAFAELPNALGRYRLIITPHEPTAAHLGHLERQIAASDLFSIRLSEVNERGGEIPNVIIVDRVGILGDLYAVADVAYVGGGFGTAGLHSVLEPAAFRIPVLFGPHHSNAREAAMLIALGGGFSVTGETDLARTLALLMADGALRHKAGEAAGDYVQSGVGAAERGARLVLDAIRGSSGLG